MINSKTIDAFLARELQDYDWIKGRNISDEPGMVGLWQHQRACHLLINELKRFIVHIGMGGGKTLLTLSVISRRKQLGEPIKAIVFVPYLTSVETWVEETAKHTPHLKCVPLLGTGEENRHALNWWEGDLFVMCYQSAVASLSCKNYGKWSLQYEELHKYFHSFNMLVLDEIHKCKSIQSLTYKMCLSISRYCEWCIGLTGTPFGNDLQDLWPQFNLVDFGETLGSTMGLYRQAFFNQHVNYWGGYEYKFKHKMLPVLKRFIKNRSIHYSVDEFSDMPPKSYIVKKLNLPDDALGYREDAYNKMKEALKGKRADAYRELESHYLRLQQLGSGFMTLKGEDNDKVKVQFDDNPKLDALEEIIDAAPNTSKLIVFHHFVYTSELISERLKSIKVGFTAIHGSVRDPIDRLRRFKSDPKCRILVINCRSGSSSLNLQLANYVVFFEQPTSAIDRQQAEARCWRPGQDKRVLIYDLICKSTMDAKQHATNLSGENLLKALLSGEVEL